MSKPKTIKGISLMNATDLKKSDLYCNKCNYVGNIIVIDEWPTYQNPNFDLIVKKHTRYMKWLDLCPTAIKLVLHEYVYMCCPKCEYTRLCISPQSTFHPEWIRNSLNCHNV